MDTAYSDNQLAAVIATASYMGPGYLAIWDQAISGNKRFILKVTSLMLEMFEFSETKWQTY